MSRIRVQRAIGASLGLVVFGALAGAGVGVGVLAVWGLLADGIGGFPYVWFAFEFAAAVGALLGGILLPFVTWAVLPHVAFYRIIAEASLGTAVGAALAIVTTGAANPLTAASGGALGFLASIAQLRLRHPRAAQRDAPVHDAT